MSDHTPVLPHQETAPLTAIRAQIVEMRAEALRTGWPDGPAKIAHLLNKHADALEKAFLALASPLAEGDEMKEHDQDLARRVIQAESTDDPPQPAAGDTSTVSVADSLPKCGHRNALVDDYRTETLSDGVTIRVRTPRRFTVTKNQRFCLECGQLVDGDDKC